MGKVWILSAFLGVLSITGVVWLLIAKFGVKLFEKKDKE